MLSGFQQMSQLNGGEWILITNKTNTPFQHPVTEIKLTHGHQITVIFRFEQQPTEIWSNLDLIFFFLKYYLSNCRKMSENYNDATISI